MKNKTIYIDIGKNVYDIMMLIQPNLNQAIKCCAIIDAFSSLVKKKPKYKENELYRVMIDCTYRDLLMSISRIYDESRGNNCSINEFNKYLKMSSFCSFTDEVKSKILNMFKPLQDEYHKLYKHDRNKKLAHTDFINFYGFNRHMYSYEQIREFVLKTKEVFEYIMSINNGYMFFEDEQELRDKYLLLFK